MEIYRPGGAPALLDRHGVHFADLALDRRRIVPLADIPLHVRDAFIAIEDRRFYAHRGLDWRRVLGAAVANVRAGDFAQGFSTITMQLARNVFRDELPAEERSLTRKLREVRVARAIEGRYDKNAILELYLNQIYFGNGARGIDSAARHYFGRVPADLDLAQGALLAALPNAPSRFDPRRHPDAARGRRDLVLAQMAAAGRISADAAAHARRASLGVVPRAGSAPAPPFAGHFVEQVRRAVEQHVGEAIYEQPVRIWTTLDASLQTIAEAELPRQLTRIETGTAGSFPGPRYARSRPSREHATAYLQGAVVALDPHHGDALAWVGGRDFLHSRFDRVISARRQVGSVFKPFVYAAALQHGFHLNQLLLDVPLRARLSHGKPWEPRNYAGDYDGAVSLRTALAQSKNAATVQLAHQLGYRRAIELARRAGLPDEATPMHPSVVLGASAASPLDLAALTPCSVTVVIPSRRGSSCGWKRATAR